MPLRESRLGGLQPGVRRRFKFRWTHKLRHEVQLPVLRILLKVVTCLVFVAGDIQKELALLF